MGGIIPVKTIEEIENYIEEQDQNGALLVTGKWGSGKTYLIRQIEKKLNQEPKYLMAVVSLFGIEDTNTLSKKVKEAVAYAQTFNIAEISGKGHIAKGVNIAKQLSEKAAALNCTPFVRQYGILSNKWGVFLCQKEYQTNDIRRNSKNW